MDLRRNSGGDEQTAAAIASLLADKPYIYARQQIRSGDGFIETSPRKIERREGKTFNGPVVCLLGPGAVSSAEGFALMMKAMRSWHNGRPANAGRQRQSAASAIAKRRRCILLEVDVSQS